VHTDGLRTADVVSPGARVETVARLNPSNAEGREESHRESNNGKMDHYRVRVSDRVGKIESAVFEG
jgi:hypothetical protein